MNNDVLTEILLHLPVQSLLRFRAVCKFWGELIDSPYFRKLHNSSNNSDDDIDSVCIRVFFRGNRLWIKLRRKKESLLSYESDHFNGFSLSNCVDAREATVVGPVKGLICINHSSKLEKPLVICNPFLGQVKILPLITFTTPSCRIGLRHVAIVFDEEDEEDYKVVQLLSCHQHRRLHAHLYSARTNSWRELAGDLDHLELMWCRTVESRCKNGYFAHWLVRQHLDGKSKETVILSFDMKNQVFWKVASWYPIQSPQDQLFAEDEHSFICILVDNLNNYPDKYVEVAESRCEGSHLSWNHLMRKSLPYSKVPLGGAGCLFVKDGWGPYIVYDYRARKLVGRCDMNFLRSEIVKYRGSFVSLSR